MGGKTSSFLLELLVLFEPFFPICCVLFNVLFYLVLCWIHNLRMILYMCVKHHVIIICE